MESEEKINLSEERIIEIERYIQDKKYAKKLFKTKQNKSLKEFYKSFMWELNHIMKDNSIDKKFKEKKINEIIKTYYFDYKEALQKNIRKDDEGFHSDNNYSAHPIENIAEKSNENKEQKIQEDKRFKILDDLRKKNIISVYEAEAILKKLDKAFKPKYLKDKDFTKEAENMFFRRGSIKIAWHLNNK